MANAAFDAKRVATELARELLAAGTRERAEWDKGYLKSELEHYGVTMPALQRIARNMKRTWRGLEHDDVIALVEDLWRRPVHDTRALAVEVLDMYVGRLAPADLPLLEKLLRESRTWALVDLLSVSVVGDVVERFPATAGKLDRWAKDPDFWIRRAAMLALLRPLRHGEGDFERFGRYADAMLEEKEFFIRKAIGWILREVSKKRPDLVWDWLRPRAARASGLTVREASKYLPTEQRKLLLERQAAPARKR